nr:MAG TPA: hypothetical protein [Caudoviricetes sp.]
MKLSSIASNPPKVILFSFSIINILIRFISSFYLYYSM